MARTRAWRRHQDKRIKQQWYRLHCRRWGTPEVYEESITNSTFSWRKAGWIRHPWEWTVKHDRFHFHCNCDWCGPWVKAATEERYFKKYLKKRLLDESMYDRAFSEESVSLPNDTMTEDEFDDTLYSLLERGYIEYFYNEQDEQCWRITLLGQIALEKEKTMRKYRS